MIKDRLKARFARCVQAVKNDKQFYGFAALAVAIAVLFVSVMYNKTLPFAEGWYTYYAQCINRGLVPYRDFEYLYSPMYIYLVAFITKIFGYELIVLRRLGIVFFALIALGLYLSATVIVGKKRSYIALIASVAAVFYLQSEVVQLFYDYIRLMDVFAAFSLYFLLRTVKSMTEGKPYRRDLVLCGIFSAVFINIKQNIGLIFFVYALILVIYIALWCRFRMKTVIIDAACMLVPLAVVMALVFLPLLINGALAPYLSMTGVSAAGAKGGMQAVLFGWITNNAIAFLHSVPVAFVLLVFLVGSYLFYRFCVQKKLQAAVGMAAGEAQNDRLAPWLGLGFAMLAALGVMLLVLSRGFAQALVPKNYFSTYALFLAVFPIFVTFGVWGLIDIAKKTDTMRAEILIFSLAGAYFAISFGCGNSGGLAEGQASFGIVFLVVAALLLCEKYIVSLHALRAVRVGGNAVRCLVAALSLLLVLQCGGKKMVATYNWWGMNESDYWASTETTSLPLLGGIEMSAETKAVYESVCYAIMENTDEGDPIYCFPQIPLIYSLCNRSDPGVFAKVQWFDVASDAAVIGDIEVLGKNPPKAVVIYNTSDYAYTSHENAFRGGNASGTRLMREFLYNYVADHGYRFYGAFAANDNIVSLWIADASGATPCVNFAGGTGTAGDPFLIETPAQLQMFSQMVQAGRSFHGQYVRLAADIDMEGYRFTPIDGEGSRFSGSFSMEAYTVSNLPQAAN